MSKDWQALCLRSDLVAHSGVVAWLDGRQIALFYLPEEEAVYAVGNRDPRSGANVIGRGILGQMAGELVVASPLYKQHFACATAPAWSSPPSNCPPGQHGSMARPSKSA